MGIKKVNKLYNIVVSSNIFHLQPELCKSVHKCNFGEFLNFRNFWTNDVTDDVIGVVGSIFWVILRVYIYDVIISKFHQNRSVNKKSTGGSKSPPPGRRAGRKNVRCRKSPPPHTPREHNYCGLTAWPICMIFFFKMSGNEFGSGIKNILSKFFPVFSRFEKNRGGGWFSPPPPWYTAG